VTLVPHVTVIEALSSGTGLRIVDAALSRSREVTFLTGDARRYRSDASYPLLDKCRVIDGFPTNDETALTGFLREQGERAGSAPAVISLADRVIEPVAAACDALGIPFAPVASVRRAQDKSAFRTLCARAGIPAPRSTDVRSAAEALDAAGRLGLPVVLKPARGTGSYGVSACYDADEVPAAFASAWRVAGPRDVPVQVEELAVGPLVSVELLATRDAVHVLGFTDRVLSPYPDFIELADAFPVTLGERDTAALHYYCRRLARALGFSRGPAHVEFALTGDGPKAIEFNPRLAGRNVGPMIEAALEWDLYGALVDIAATGTCPPPPATIRAAAEHAVYATHAGILHAVAGQEVARLVPGVRDVRLTMQPGETIPETRDQRVEIAVTWAVGETTDEASARARTAAAALRPVIEPAPGACRQET
jgi:biotin carboxylase